MRKIFWSGIQILAIASMFLSVSEIFAASYAVDGTFTTTVVSDDQVGNGEIKASVTMQLGDANGSMAFFDGPDNTNACRARYSYFLGTNQTVIYDCVSPNYTDLATRRTSNNFIILDGYSRNPPLGGVGQDIITQRTPTELAAAIAALGTNGDYSLSSNGRQITYTRIAAETDPNGSTITPVQLSQGSLYLSHISSRTGYPARPDLYSTVDFIPANVGSGETYEMTIGTLSKDVFGVFNHVYTQVYTATGSNVAEIMSRLVAAYDADPSPYGITCADNTTKVTCTSPNHNVAISGSSRVIYGTPDTTEPTITLIGSGTIYQELGAPFTDPGAQWGDNRDGTGIVMGSGTVNHMTLGTYTLEYIKTDIAGNTGAVVTRTINVVDTTAPVLMVNGSDPVTVEIDTGYADEGAIWSDLRDGTGGVIADSYMITALGPKVLTYTKADTSGNTGTITRTLNVVDTIAPTLSISTADVTVDANIYRIDGSFAGRGSITVSGGASPVTLASVNSRFTAFVPLIQNATNTLLVTLTDLGGNTATGSVIITESSGVSSFSGAVAMSGSSLGIVSSYSGASLTGTTRLVVETPVFFGGSGGQGVIPGNTVITSASGGTGTFDATSINQFNVTVTGGLSSNEIQKGALGFGIADTGLHFSKPVKIQIPVPGYTASTIAIKVKHGGTSTYVTTGLTNNPSATCTNGMASSPSATATVELGIATIYTCAASTFVAYTETIMAPLSSGGGASSSSSSTTVSWQSLPSSTQASTGVLTPPKDMISTNTEITRITLDKKAFRYSKILRINTNLKNGTRVTVYRVGKDGKEVRVGQPRVSRSIIFFRPKTIGTYVFR